MRPYLLGLNQFWEFLTLVRQLGRTILHFDYIITFYHSSWLLFVALKCPTGGWKELDWRVYCLRFQFQYSWYRCCVTCCPPACLSAWLTPLAFSFPLDPVPGQSHHKQRFFFFASIPLWIEEQNVRRPTEVLRWHWRPIFCPQLELLYNTHLPSPSEIPEISLTFNFDISIQSW